MQGVWGVVWEKWDGSLEQDGAAIYFKGNPMDGAASDANLSSDRLLDGMSTFEGR